MCTHTPMWCKRIVVLNIHVYVFPPLYKSVKTQKKKNEKQAPVCHGAASLCGVGLILSDDIQSDCPRLTAFTITEERHAVVNKNVFTISKDLLYPRLY